MNSRQKESVNIIIQNSEGKYLLQMRDNTKGICNPLKWNFFGGGLQSRDPIANAQRELKEELEIKTDLKDLKAVGCIPDTKVHIVRYNQVVNWSDFHLLEGAGAGYFNKEEILAIDSTENTKLIVKQYLQGI